MELPTHVMRIRLLGPSSLFKQAFTRLGGNFMIKLTRLDGEPFVLNADLIRYIERRPDTFITLINGERIVVGETSGD